MDIRPDTALHMLSQHNIFGITKLESLAKIGASILLKLNPSTGEVLEERLLVLGVLLDNCLEGALQKSQIGNQHDRSSGRVLLLRTSLGRGLIRILLGQHLGKVRIIKFQRCLGPRSIKSRTIRVTSPHGVRPAQGDDIPIGEPLGVENLPQVIHSLISIGKTPHLRLHRLVRRSGILPPEPGGDGRTAHHLDRHVGRQGPQIGVADDSALDVLVRNGLEESHGHVGKAGVGAEASFAGGGEAHGGVGAAAGEGAGGVDAGVVPAEADEDGAARFFLDEGGEVGFDIGEGHGGCCCWWWCCRCYCSFLERSEVLGIG
mmetsp:Transcript_4262/g.9192  ORF Transcript_4262/g.9192 Transcript_4262/m.9192 type:complete len:317 (+) Transcript_4262:66-1016(+)